MYEWFVRWNLDILYLLTKNPECPFGFELFRCRLTQRGRHVEKVFEGQGLSVRIRRKDGAETIRERVHPKGFQGRQEDFVRNSEGLTKRTRVAHVPQVAKFIVASERGSDLKVNAYGN